MTKIKSIILIFLLLMVPSLGVNAMYKENLQNSVIINYELQGNLSIGEIVTLSIKTSNLDELYGASLDFRFDESQIEIIEVNKGNLFSDKAMVVVNNISPGEISFVTTEIGNYMVNNKAGTLFNLKVRVLKEGMLRLTPTADYIDYKASKANLLLKLSNQAAQNIPYSLNVEDFKIVSQFKLNNINVNLSSPQEVGTPIRITPEVSGGTGNLQYKYWIWFDGKWTVVQDFSSSSSYEWTPTQAGNYKIWVDVKDSMGTMKSKEISYVVTEAALNLSKIKVDKASPQEVGTPVKITPEVSGGTGNLQYKYWIWFDGKWTIVQDFSSSSSYEWTPTQAGNYKIWVDIKDSMETTKSKEISYVVTEAALNLSKIKVDKASPQAEGTTVKITPEVI